MEEKKINNQLNENDSIISNEDNIDIFYFIRIISRYKIFILTSTFIIGVVSIIYVLTATPMYQSVATMYPVQKGQSGPLRELANTFGLANKIEGFNIPEVVKSETIAKVILLKKFKTLAYKDSVDLLEYWGLYKKYPKKEFAIERGIKILRGMMSVKDDKETFLISIVVRMNERQLAADVVNSVAVAVTNYLQYEQKKTTISSRIYLEKRLEKASKELLGIENDIIDFKEQNYQQSSPALRAEIIRLERKFGLMNNFVLMLSKQRELILLDEVRDKPVINTLDDASTMYKPISPKKREIVITNTFAAFIFSVFLVFLKEKYYNDELISKIRGAVTGKDKAVS